MLQIRAGTFGIHWRGLTNGQLNAVYQGAFAEFERALICERHREGIALVKQRRACRGRHEIVDR
jgi:DNA invertase Pin-like site-specific DNA recombinase